MRANDLSLRREVHDRLANVPSWTSRGFQFANRALSARRWALTRGARLALVDSGASDSPGLAIEPALRELGLHWSDLDYLINTHGHPDHLGGNGEVK